jgi:hypothetical protein
VLFWFLVFLQIVFGLVAGESTIRQTPEGEKSLDALSKGGLFFLCWRAHSNYKQELVGLRNIFGITALVFTILLFSIGPTNPPSLFNAMPGLFLVLWLTMQFGTNFKKSVKEQLSIAGLFIIGPWLILGMDYLTGFQYNQLRLMALPFNSFEIQSLETYQIAIVLSAIGGITWLIMAVFSVIFFSIVPLFFLFLIVFLSALSKATLKTSPKTAKNLSLLYCFLIGPLLMALESKGVI